MKFFQVRPVESVRKHLDMMGFSDILALGLEEC
jgi:hypothetical protein